MSSAIPHPEDPTSKEARAANAGIPKEDKIPLVQKISFSFGANTENMAVGLMVNSLWMPFFNIGLGMSPVILGIILMVFRIWDAFSDTFIGNLSDNASTKWGRRKPFMVGGIIAAACIYPTMWFMPDLSESLQVAYLIFFGILFFTAMTMWGIPFHALQMELTPNYDERTRLTMWISVGTKLSLFASGWVMAIATSQLFANPETGEGDIVAGMKVVCWFLVGVFLITGLVPVLFVKERFRGQVETAKNRQSFWYSVKDSFKCSPLRILIGVSFFLSLGNMALGAVFQYANIYYVFGGDISAASVLFGWKTTVSVITALVSIPIIGKLAERYDKMTIMISMLGLMLVAHLLNLFLMRPDMPYLQLVAGSAEAMGISGFWILLASMKADVADFDELNTGRRREGSINAFYSWFLKVAMTMAVGFSGLVLELTGFDAQLPEQTEQVVQSLRYNYIFLPLGFWAVAMVLGFGYKLNRKRMDEIRAKLEERRGVVQLEA